jgi:hypothetical protein
VQCKTSKKKKKRLSEVKLKVKCAEGMAQVVEDLPGKQCEALT